MPKMMMKRRMTGGRPGNSSSGGAYDGNNAAASGENKAAQVGWIVVVVIILVLIIWGIVAAVRRTERKRKQQKQRNEDAYYDEEGFTETDASYKLVYVHMDGCSFCRKFDPVWKELKQKHGKQFSDMGVVMEDYESKSSEAAQLDPNGYPSILLVKDGNKVATFDGPRTIPELVQFVNTNVK